MWSIRAGRGAASQSVRSSAGLLDGLVDFGKQDGRVQTLPGAGFGDGNLAPAAKIDAVLFEDAYGGGRLGGDLADGAIGSGCGHASIMTGKGREVGDRSHRTCAWTIICSGASWPPQAWRIVSMGSMWSHGRAEIAATARHTASMATETGTSTMNSTTPIP